MPVIMFMIWFIYTGIVYVALELCTSHDFAGRFVVPISCFSILAVVGIWFAVASLKGKMKISKPAS